MQTPADLTHVDTWLFDLDNTLYPLDSGLALEIDRRIRDYVIQVTGLEPEEAYRLQKRYLAEHGLSLTGLIRDHSVDPAEFHAIFEDLPLDLLAHDPELIAALRRLPGRRLIFTNADGGHAQRVAERLGLSGLFDDIFHIGSADFEPKPSPGAFAKIIAAHAIEPKTTAFFEDAERNLKPAAALGMTTVLVGAHAADSTADFVHHRTARLAPFLAAIRVKEHR
ncbi:pyrimidine 5'-nucleotidase [Caulobacter sp. KR2-114]|uniref:pyrimidine 5'-nucleotidase n=1 Tax=Caulobacter sp. KR2-114 TaxID=3400912 RepID=UPI003C1175CC